MSDFQTSDLATASFLLCQPSVTFVETRPKDQRSRYFVFTPQHEAKALVAQFVSGKAMVNAKQLTDNMRTAKDLVFESERESLRTLISERG